MIVRYGPMNFITDRLEITFLNESILKKIIRQAWKKQFQIIALQIQGRRFSLSIWIKPKCGEYEQISYQLQYQLAQIEGLYWEMFIDKEKKSTRPSENKNSLTLQDNDKIVSLIKAKINPIHHRTLRQTPKDMTLSAPNFYPKKSKEYDIIDPKELKTFELLARQPSAKLLSKAKEYVEERRKNLVDLDKTQSVIDLKIYTRLFDANEGKENPMVKEFLKMKRESMQMMSFYERPKRVVPLQTVQINEKTEQQCSELNARMRRKLNHKKLIAMYRFT